MSVCLCLCLCLCLWWYMCVCVCVWGGGVPSVAAQPFAQLIHRLGSGFCLILAGAHNQLM